MSSSPPFRYAALAPSVPLLLRGELLLLVYLGLLLDAELVDSLVYAGHLLVLRLTLKDLSLCRLDFCFDNFKVKFLILYSFTKVI